MRKHDYTIAEMIEGILTWADEANPEFNTDFVESVKHQMEEGKDLSSAQIHSIENIFDRWRVGTWLEKHY